MKKQLIMEALEEFKYHSLDDIEYVKLHGVTAYSFMKKHAGLMETFYYFSDEGRGWLGG